MKVSDARAALAGAHLKDGRSRAAALKLILAVIGVLAIADNSTVCGFLAVDDGSANGNSATAVASTVRGGNGGLAGELSGFAVSISAKLETASYT